MGVNFHARSFHSGEQVVIDLRRARRIAIIGGGIAGWLAALTVRRVFSPAVEVLVLEDPEAGIVGAGEGGLLNLLSTLNRNGIDIDEFVRETGAAYKLGSVFEGWRTGRRDDEYYHLFPMAGEQVQEIELAVFGAMPLLAARVSTGTDLHSFFPGISLIANNASQLETRAVLATKRSGLAPSYHFDSHKAAAYLKSVALKRGVFHRQVEAQKLLLTPEGMAYAAQIQGEEIPVDFVVDASGLRRLGIGETYKEKWRSFKDFLILDRAMPFDIPHPRPNPALLTRSVAMSSGWMWQIPLQQRIDAGYVFSSKHADAEAAKLEAEKYLGFPVEPQKVIEFEAGNFDRVWRNNVIAFGPSAGFVEPLEAASLGQMLESLRNVEKILVDSRGVIGGGRIDAFNRSNSQSWSGVADFLRMHYDNVRNDTPFWKDVANIPSTQAYWDLRNCFSQRLPRMIDLEAYMGNGWAPIFHMVTWLFVGAALGVVTQNAAGSELMSLPADIRQRVAPYLAQLHQDNNVGFRAGEQQHLQRLG
jgi:tryptophan halogenase